MKRFSGFMMTVLILSAGIAIGYGLAKWGTPARGGGNGNQARSDVVSSVKTSPIRWGKITESAAAYGKVVANHRLEKNVAAAFGVRVLKVLVIKGQRVSAGQALLQIKASPAERLRLAEATKDAATARMQLRLIQTRLKLELATQSELVAARNALATAVLNLAELRRLGVGTLITVRAPAAGTVAQVAAIPGALEPRGITLLKLVPQSAILADLKVIPPDVRRLRLHQPIDLTIATNGAAVHEPGRISMIAGWVNSTSGLVDVYVTPDNPAALRIGHYVSALLPVATGSGLIVPHSAVLPKNGGEYLFTLSGSHAVEHSVRIGVSNDMEVEVFAKALRAGEPVVTAGNSVLTNGMAVKQETSR